MENQIRFMQRALDIAEKGIGRVSPNPPVGCVLVQNNELLLKDGTIESEICMLNRQQLLMLK